jgi:Tol biopolymer transport system component
MAETRPRATSEVAGVTTTRLAYIEFGLTRDTLWLADTSSPGDREQVLTIPHAASYGVLATVSPDGARFAYTALPEDLARPKPDSPAGLWIATLDGRTEPRLLADDIDLLVAPLWTPDGASLVYRRSAGGAHMLAITDAEDGAERVLASSEEEALFPIGFSPMGTSLYFAGLSERGGTRLYEVSPATGGEREVATLSASLTRDWALSPDGSRLAYLEIAFTEVAVASRASVLDIATGQTVPVTSPDEVAFGPVWSATGELAIGVFDPSTGEASILVFAGESSSRLDGPPEGFDVPLAYDPVTGSYVARTFENDSVTAPGRSSLTLIGPGGERTTIAEGETSLVGWIRP